MGVASVSQTIQFILAPAIMISACAIILGGLLGRYAAVNDRLRVLAHERFDLIRAVQKGEVDALTPERIREIDAQLPDLLRRHKLDHNTILTLYCAMLTFILTMLVIALALQIDAVWASLTALVIFLIGTGILAFSIALTIMEVSTSQRSIIYEVKEISSLKY